MRASLKVLLSVLLIAGVTVVGRGLSEPQPTAVDFGEVTRGPLKVTVRAEGKTRIREVYTISAPISGRLLRVDGEPGDAVEAGRTVVANLLPSTPALLDARTRAEAEARVRSAEAALGFARAEVKAASTACELAQSELQRATALRRSGAITAARLEALQLQVRSAEARLETAQAAVRIREAEREIARARLAEPSATRGEPGPSAARPDRSPEEPDGPGRTGPVLKILAPISGVVLRLHRKSEAVVAAGAPILEVGNPRNLEVEVELLSTDAVRVQPGASAQLEAWGGETPLRATVRRIEPFGFKRISALGIEEQRVRAILDLSTPAEERPGLGHGFRVEAEITVWEGASVVSAPSGALFREGSEWATFVRRGDRVRLAKIRVGRRNDRRVEILSGLEAGDQVVLHPGAGLADGGLIAERSGATGPESKK